MITAKSIVEISVNSVIFLILISIKLIYILNPSYKLFFIYCNNITLGNQIIIQVCVSIDKKVGLKILVLSEYGTAN